ncbi:MAG TPA: GNAT family N-acetyltransferase [Gaiellaceae bacterium]|nr:GNAT family N-acetyltransferase [Gaiellaceae bacterium]
MPVATDAGVRSLEPVDWPAVRAIYELGRATGRATLETATPSWELWDAAHIRGHRWVAVVDEDVVGWAALAHPHRTAGRGVAESSVYVEPRFHRQGVGSALLRRLVDESERAGFWTLEARVVEGNDPSLQLHVAQGFRLVGVRERIGLWRGSWLDVLLLERRSRIVGV